MRRPSTTAAPRGVFGVAASACGEPNAIDFVCWCGRVGFRLAERHRLGDGRRRGEAGTENCRRHVGRSRREKGTRSHDLKGEKAIVVVFLSFECPISTAYSPVLAEMAKRYAEQGSCLCRRLRERGRNGRIGRQAGGTNSSSAFPCLQDGEGRGGRRLQGRKDARGLRARSQLRAPLPRPDRRRLCRPPEEEPADHRATTWRRRSTNCVAGKAVSRPIDDGDRLPDRRSRERSSATGP